jgi:hypothetical protein
MTVCLTQHAVSDVSDRCTPDDLVTTWARLLEVRLPLIRPSIFAMVLIVLFYSFKHGPVVTENLSRSVSVARVYGKA